MHKSFRKIKPVLQSINEKRKKYPNYLAYIRIFKKSIAVFDTIMMLYYIERIKDILKDGEIIDEQRAKIEQHLRDLGWDE